MASEIRVNQIQNRSGLSTVTFSDTGAVVSGIVTANSFSGNITGNVTGSGANLTSIPAAQLTGTVADARLSTVSSSKLSGALPAIDGSNLTGINTAFGSGTSINTTGIITATAFVPSSQGALSHRNKIINGGQQIFQRGTSDERYGGNDGYYNGIADRWAIRMHSSVAQTTFSQDTSNNPHGFGFNQKSVRSNAGSASASKYYVYDTKLEGQDLQDFAKGTSSAKEFTLSFYVRTGVSGVYCCEMRDLDNSRMVGGTYTVSNGNWNRYVITFPADTTGAFGNDNGASLWVRFWLAAGSNFTSGTARTAWAAGAPDSVLAAGQTAQVGDNTADTWQITGIQLEVGSVATPFEHRSLGEEFIRCQRYYEQSYNYGTAPGAQTDKGSIMFLTNRNSGTAHTMLRFQTRKRDNPSMTSYITTATNTTGMRNLDDNVTYNYTMNRTGQTGCTAYPTGSLSLGKFIQFHYTADAEL